MAGRAQPPAPPNPMRPVLLVIDNYDSFTFNLVHFLGDLGAETRVVRNDALDVGQAMALGADGIVLSPGPCDPDKAGICLDLIQAAAGTVPIFGVCLGFQAIGQAFGGRVVPAPQLMHGKTSAIHHRGGGVLAGLPSPFQAARYHSLCLEADTLPDCLAPVGWTEDGVVMAIAHQTLPIHGVLFHPESIASEHGHRVLDRFLAIAGRRTAP